MSKVNKLNAGRKGSVTIENGYHLFSSYLLFLLHNISSDGTRGENGRDLLPGTPYTKEDLANANVTDLGKFGKRGEWNYRTHALETVHATYGESQKLDGYRQQLTDQGNWAFGYSGNAADLDLLSLHIIGGIKQIIDLKVGSTDWWSTFYGNPRDYKYITEGFYEFDGI